VTGCFPARPRNPRPGGALPAAALRRAGRLAVAVLLLSAAACSESPDDVVGSSNPPDPTATFSRVQREVFTPTCALAGCHTAASAKAGLILDAGRSYGSLVGVVSLETGYLRVMAGLPNDSYLVIKIRGDADIVGSLMPPGSASLSTAQKQLVVDWIRRGALND
jgi:hypothetical protein